MLLKEAEVPHDFHVFCCIPLLPCFPCVIRDVFVIAAHLGHFSFHNLYTTFPNPRRDLTVIWDPDPINQRGNLTGTVNLAI